MNFDSENSGSILKRLSVNTSLKDARIFDEDSNDSTTKMKERKERGGKMKSSKKNNKGSPYKTSNKKNIEYETDPSVLERRQKQIDYGKNTIGYDNYIASIPINKRKKEHPKTPNKYLKYSRRGWDCLVKIWRMKLHEFDPKNEDGENVEMDDDLNSENGESVSESNVSKESIESEEAIEAVKNQI